MNHSIYSADRGTHLKIVVMALVVAIATAGIAITSHVDSGIARSAMVKAGKSVTVTALDVPLIR